jgi:hypothetical protein
MQWDLDIPIAKIAEAARCAPSTVRRYTRDNPRRIHCVTPAMSEEISTRLSKGHKPATIARSMDLHVTTVRKHRRILAGLDQSA